jgi:hypothetical protein
MLETLSPGELTTACEVHALGSARPRLWLGAGNQLWLELGGKTVAVRPVHCFPWSAPGELVSLRDSEDSEHYLVEQLEGLDTASAAALRLATESAGFVLEIEAILGIEEDYEVRVWRARTRHGTRTFQTKLDEWPWAAPDGGYLLRDLCGDLFHVPRVETLDAVSQKWLWAYVG